MRINNSRIKHTILTAYLLLFFTVIFGIIVFGLFKIWIENLIIKHIVFVVFFALLFKVAKYFEYDSGGEILVVINKVNDKARMQYTP